LGGKDAREEGKEGREKKGEGEVGSRGKEG